MPEQQSDALTPATRLLEKKREMAEVETALAAQKEEFQLKMETLQQRRDDLERKERSLKEQLLKFEKFLKVCALESLSYNFPTRKYSTVNELNKTTNLFIAAAFSDTGE